jgi:O-antigen/teichoic acid export membrane protein
MFIKKFKEGKDKIFSGVVIVTAGMLTGSFFSYLLQFFLGRMLSVEDYGTFNALLSLSYIIGVPSTVLGTAAIKVSSEMFAKEKHEELTALFWRLTKYFFILGLFLFGAMALLRNVLSEILNISDAYLFISYGLFLGLSYLVVTPAAYLQGMLRFGAFSFYTVVNSVLRFTFPVILVYLGFRVGGVFWGMIDGLLVAFVITLLILRKNFVKYDEVNLSPALKRLLMFSLPVLLVNTGLMLLNNLDMVLVKRYFDPTLSGYYAGAVTLGKILLFGTITIVVIMFPKISALYTKKESYTNIFRELLFLQILLVLGGVLFYVLFPGFITTLFFGERFAHSISYIPPYAIFIGLYVLVRFMVMFFLAIEKTKVAFFLIPAAVIQLILISLFHRDLFQVIHICSIVTAALLISLFVYAGFSNRACVQAGKNNLK